MTDLRSLSMDALAEALGLLGEPKYRASQLFSWIHEKRASSFEEMTNLPKSLRAKLAERFSLYVPVLVRKQVSKDGTITAKKKGKCQITATSKLNKSKKVVITIIVK